MAQRTEAELFAEEPIDRDLDELDGEEEERPPLVISEDDPNIAATIELAEGPDSETLKDISEQIRTKFTSAWDRTEELRQNFSTMWKLFAGYLPKKDFPFEDCANAHVPVMIENLVRIAYRVHDEIVGDGQNVIGVMPVGSANDPVADIMTLHDNWQFREKIRDWDAQLVKGLLLFFMDGHAFVHSYYDPIEETNAHEFLTPEEFVTPYAYRSLKPDLSDLPYYCRVMPYHGAELERMRDHYLHVDDLLEGKAPSWDDEPDQELARTGAMVAKDGEPADDEGAPYKLIWFEGWLKLPTQQRQRWCKCIWEEQSGHILSLTIHEEPDWQDKHRYEQQTAELEQYQQHQQAYMADMEQRTMQLEQLSAMQEQGQVPPAAAMQMRGQLGMQRMPAPQLPEWAQDEDAMPEEPRWVPIRLFHQAKMIEPLAGSHGLGFGNILKDYQIASSTLLSQFIDQATLNNCPHIFVCGTNFGEKFAFKPGALTAVEGLDAQEFKDAIHEIRPGQANPQMLDTMKYLEGKASAASQSQEVLSGAPGKSGETYRGLSARLEQATKMLTVPGRIFVKLLERVFKANAYLNSIFLPEQELVEIAARSFGQVMNVPVKRDMYERSYNVIFRADLRFTSQQQRINEAAELLQLPQMIPEMQMNIAFKWRAAAQMLKARGMHDWLSLLGPEPPPPMTPLGMPPPMAGPPPGPGGAPGPGGGGTVPEGGPV